MPELSRRSLLRAAVVGVSVAGSVVVRGDVAAARPSTSTQYYWRYCDNCHEMFYDGYPQKGICPGGGSGHVASGYYFALPYDAPTTPHDQPDWRYCTKCHA